MVKKAFHPKRSVSGKYWCVSRSISGKLACFNWPTSVAEVRVPVVMRICVSGRAPKNQPARARPSASRQRMPHAAKRDFPPVAAPCCELCARPSGPGLRVRPWRGVQAIAAKARRQASRRADRPAPPTSVLAFLKLRAVKLGINPSAASRSPCVPVSRKRPCSST